MSGTTNAALRAALTRNPLTIVDVYSADDLPTPLVLAPDGNMRSLLVQGVNYRFQATFACPLLWVPAAVAQDTSQTIQFTAALPSIVLLFAGSDTPHIWGRGIGSFFFRGAWGFVDVSNAGAGRGTVLFDLVGGTQLSLILFEIIAFINCKRVGNFVDLGLQILSSLVQNAEGGMVARVNAGNILSHAILGLRGAQLPAATAMQKPLLCLQGDPITAAIANGNISLSAGDNAFCIDSAAGGDYNFGGNTYGGTSNGNFFSADDAASITAMANADIAIASFSDSTADPGVDTTVNFATQPGLVIGQVILIADEAAYNGTHTIVRVAADELSFDINVVHSTSGAGTLKLTRFTSVSHGLVRDATNTVSGTAAYDGTTQTVFVTNDTFDLPVAFVTDETTGTVSSASQNETTVGVDAQNNGAQPNSKNLAFAQMNGNSTATTIAADSVYQALDFSGLVNNDVSERFTLTDATAGVYTYNGNTPIVVKVGGIPNATKGGATANYRFAASVNGQLPQFAIPATAITSVTDSGGIARFNYTEGASPPFPTFVTQEVTVSGFVTNTAYNVTGRITVRGVGFFEISSVAFGSDETGSFLAADSPYSPMEVKTTKVSAMVSEFVSIVTSDTIQVMGAGDGTADNLTLTDYIFEIEG